MTFDIVAESFFLDPRVFEETLEEGAGFAFLDETCFLVLETATVVGFFAFETEGFLELAVDAEAGFFLAGTLLVTFLAGACFAAGFGLAAFLDGALALDATVLSLLGFVRVLEETFFFAVI